MAVERSRLFFKDLSAADVKLRAWRKKYDTPEKVRAAHRKVLLERVSQSMAFEGQPVSIVRLKILLKQKAKGGSR
jgi:hypothetical protein